MNEEFSGDEYLPLMFSGFVAVAGFMSWYVPSARVAVLGRGRNERWSLLLAPLVCLGQIWFVLEFFAAGEVRRSGGYTFYFLVMGAGWLTVAFWLCSLLGVSFREDVLERDNPAAAAVVGGAMEAVTLGYAGANIGEGATVWTTIYPASIAIGTLFVLWFVCLKRATREMRRGGPTEGWLLKTALCNTGDTVSMRVLLTRKQWNVISRHVWWRPDRWLAQRRFASVALETPAGPLYPCLGVYTVDGKAAGVYARIAPRPLIDFAATDVALLVEGADGADGWCDHE